MRFWRRTGSPTASPATPPTCWSLGASGRRGVPLRLCSRSIPPQIRVFWLPEPSRPGLRGHYDVPCRHSAVHDGIEGFARGSVARPDGHAIHDTGVEGGERVDVGTRGQIARGDAAAQALPHEFLPEETLLTHKTLHVLVRRRA